MTNIVISHDEAKQLYESIQGGMGSHPFYAERDQDKKIAKDYFTRLTDIVGSGLHGNLDGELAEFHLKICPGHIDYVPQEPSKQEPSLPPGNSIPPIKDADGEVVEFNIGF